MDTTETIVASMQNLAIPEEKDEDKAQFGDKRSEKFKSRPVELLTLHAERFRMRLIRDFRLLENLDEIEQVSEAPKYHPQDLQYKHRRNRIMLENPYALVKFSPISKVTGLITKQERRWKRIKCRETAYPPLDMWANWIVESDTFQSMMLALILINALMLIIDAEIGDTDEPKYVIILQIIRTVDYCCLWIFIMEILLKWIDDFKTFWKNGWNELDFYITLFSLLPEILRVFNSDASSALVYGLSFFRVLRITRLLKMVSRFEQARIILMSVSKAFSAMTFILLLLALFMWMFALMGQVTFGRYTQFDGKAHGLHLRYQKAFSDILWSFSTLFQLMTLDHWLETLQDLLKVMTTPYETAVTVIYILSWIWVGSFVFKNIFAGIMVNNFQTIRNDLHWEKKEKEVKHEVDKFKNEVTSGLKDERMLVEKGSLQEESAKKTKQNALPFITVDSAVDTNKLGSTLKVESQDKINSTINAPVESRSALSFLSELSETSLHGSEPVNAGGTLRQVQWDNFIQRHLDIASAPTSETVWSWDMLFKYYQAMENLQENIKERQDILHLLNLAILQLHDE